jgi:hypothetical protein
MRLFEGPLRMLDRPERAERRTQRMTDATDPVPGSAEAIRERAAVIVLVRMRGTSM